MKQARAAIRMRVGGGRPSVTARKVGVSPTGSTTTSSVTSAETKYSLMPGVVVDGAESPNSRAFWGASGLDHKLLNYHMKSARCGHLLQVARGI